MIYSTVLCGKFLDKNGGFRDKLLKNLRCSGLEKGYEVNHQRKDEFLQNNDAAKLKGMKTKLNGAEERT